METSIKAKFNKQSDKRTLTNIKSKAFNINNYLEVINYVLIYPQNYLDTG